MLCSKLSTSRRALALACLLTLVGLQMPLSTAAAAAQSQKDALIERLSELRTTIDGLKEQVAATPGNTTLARQLRRAQREYDTISAYLGGDQASQPDLAGAGLPTDRAVPPAPPNCAVPAVTIASNNTPVAIPDNTPAGITSAIVVAGAGASIWDVDVTLNVTHTFPGDLDITLTSPAGTVVTLSTDNGGSSDDAFNGTLFDDQAGAANPPGPVNDVTYAAGVVETPVAPEEPLAALLGENPNGTWTLAIVDDAGGDVGTLTNWSISVATLPSPPMNDAPVSAANNTPAAIPDNTPAGITSAIVVAGAGAYLCDLNLTTFITHTFPGDLDITLTSPAGTVVTLSTDNGGSSDDAFNGTVWDVDAGDTNAPGGVNDVTYAAGVVETPVAPEESFAAFTGENPNGTWTLAIVDDAGGDVGTLTNWSISVVTCACAPAGDCAITCPGNLAVAATSPQGAVVTYATPTPTGPCAPGTTVACAPASGTTFPEGATTVTCTATAGGSVVAMCSFTVTVGVPFNSCIVDSATGDTFSATVSGVATDPLNGFWRYTVAATGEVFQGTANRINNRPGARLVLADTDDPAVALHAQIYYSANTATVRVLDRATGRVFVLRDYNLSDNPACDGSMPTN
jgi:subtilisin-like proprotein convertase family protein